MDDIKNLTDLMLLKSKYHECFGIDNVERFVEKMMELEKK